MIFLVNVPVGIAAAVLTPRLIAADRRSSRSSHVDVTGGILVTLAVAALVFAISEAPVLGWFQPEVIGALMVAGVASIGFVAVERSQADPLIHLALLRRRGLRTSAILTFLTGAWSAGELVVLSVYLQQTLHDSPLMAGLVIAPQGVVGFAVGIFGARLIGRIGMRALLVASTMSTGVGFLILAHLPSGGHYSPLFAAVVLVGFGTMATVFATTVMAASGMAQAHQGLVGGVVNTARQVGAAVGVAALVAIAEGSRAREGIASVSGDRTAMLVAALVGLGGAVVAWFGARPTPTLDLTTSLTEAPIPSRRTS
jgi:predicted MFS family arabinose efflux permease